MTTPRSRLVPVVIAGALVVVGGIGAAVLAVTDDDPADEGRDDEVMSGPVGIRAEGAYEGDEARRVQPLDEAPQIALVEPEPDPEPLPPPPPDPDPADEAVTPAARARAEAIEQARMAGVLGNTALVQGGAFAQLTGPGDIPTGFDDIDIVGGLIGNEFGEIEGGDGRPGAGGDGDGAIGLGGGGSDAIGLGRYGTLGHGSGAGPGVVARRGATAPKVSIGGPSCTGDLDDAIVRRYVKRNFTKISYCYEKELLARPTLQGTVEVEFDVADDGTVSASTGTGVDAAVASCIALVIAQIEFPRPKSDAAVQCTYPIALQPG